MSQTIKTFKEDSNDPNDVQELGLVFTQVRGTSRVESTCIKDVKAVAANDGTFVFPTYVPFSETFIRAVENQTPIYDTLYARQELKESMEKIVNELESRIAALKEED